LKMVASVSPRAVAQRAASNTPTVVTFTPPPVPPGAAPMNIRMTITKRALGWHAPMAIELKPAVRVIADWNQADSHA